MDKHDLQTVLLTVTLTLEIVIRPNWYDGCWIWILEHCPFVCTVCICTSILCIVGLETQQYCCKWGLWAQGSYALQCVISIFFTFVCICDMLWLCI